MLFVHHRVCSITFTKVTVQIEDLKKEGEIPLEELMVMYGLNNNEEYLKVLLISISERHAYFDWSLVFQDLMRVFFAELQRFYICG